jgi:hypothetical protein
MEPLDDFRLGSEPAPPAGPEPARGSRAPLWIVAVLVLALAAIVSVVWYVRTGTRARAATPASSAAKPPVQGDAREPLGPAVEPIDLPPLVLTDPLVRELLGRLSSSPTLAAWLASDGLIRAFAVSVENVAGGESPAKHVRALTPRSPFRTVTEGKTITVDPRSYSRYDGLGNAVASLDPAGLARVYSLLKPRLVEAYTELGHPEGNIDAAVERATVVLLQAPVVEDPVTLRPRVLSYKYERDDLETLAPAQKQLLRMGPRNVRIVQEQLRAIARELGIPSGRLPPRHAAQ